MPIRPDEVRAEFSRFRRAEVYGALVPVPGIDSELELCKLVVPQGQWAWVNVIQSVQVNPTTTVLPRIVPGLSWRLYGSGDVKATSPKAVNWQAAGPDQTWTFTDGRPAGRNIVVAPATTLIVRANFTVASLPATLQGVSAAIVGLLFDSDVMNELEALGFLSLP